MMLCNVYSKFSEADLLPSHWLQLSIRNGTECQPGKFMMVINFVENADSKWMQWTEAVAAWMWNVSVSKQGNEQIYLEGKRWQSYKYSSKCPAHLGGSAVFGWSSKASMKHRVAEIALVITDTGIQLLSLKCCWAFINLAAGRQLSCFLNVSLCHFQITV